MKINLLVFLLSVLLVPQTIFASGTEQKFPPAPRPECVAWSMKSMELIEQDKQANWKLKPGKTVDDVLDLLEAAPLPDFYNFQVANETQKQTVDHILSMPRCQTLSYYDVIRLAPKNDLKTTDSQKKRWAKILSDRFQSSADKRGNNVVELILLTKALEAGIDKKYIAVNDSAYFEFSRLEEEVQKEIGREQNNTLESGELDYKKLSDKDYKKVLIEMRTSTRATDNLYQSFVRWFKRVDV